MSLRRLHDRMVGLTGGAEALAGVIRATGLPVNPAHVGMLKARRDLFKTARLPS